MAEREVRLMDGGHVVVVDGRPQSHVDLADPTRLAFDYVRRMGDVVDALGDPGAPVRAIHVGGAGMTLPRYLAATRPGSRQTVLEPDEVAGAVVFLAGPSVAGRQLDNWRTSATARVDAILTDFPLELRTAVQK